VAPAQAHHFVQIPFFFKKKIDSMDSKSIMNNAGNGTQQDD
jgi:hypothetical protein